MNPYQRFAYLTRIIRVWVATRDLVGHLSRSQVLEPAAPERRVAVRALLRGMGQLGNVLTQENRASHDRLKPVLVRSIDLLAACHDAQQRSDGAELADLTHCVGTEAALLYAAAEDAGEGEVAAAAQELQEACDVILECLRDQAGTDLQPIDRVA